MTPKKIAFLGAGNMGRSIISGLLSQGYSKNCLRATARSKTSINEITAEYGIATGTDNEEAANWADIIILGAKPQGLQALCSTLTNALFHKPLIISVAAGIHCNSIDSWLGTSQAIVRAMPNTPALVQCGATGLFANAKVSVAQKKTAESILSSIGISLWVNSEPLIDVVTAISGSGPAYYFLFMEAMIDAGVTLGLDEKSAKALTLQTALGAATLAQRDGAEIQALRHCVTSPGGTTEQAILSFEKDGLRTMVESAMTACTAQAQHLAKALGKSS